MTTLRAGDFATQDHLYSGSRLPVCTSTCSPATTRSSSIDEEKRDLVGEELPPMDGGRKAWTYLAAAFFVEVMCYGYVSSFGVFQRYYHAHPLFAGDTTVSIIATLASGIPYLCCPVFLPYISQYPAHRRVLMVTGLGLIVGSFIAASWSWRMWQLILIQGVVFGIGNLLLYMPTLALMNEWFDERRGLSLGIMSAGTGVGGLVMPIILEMLLHHLGFEKTLRIWGLVTLIILTPSLYFVRGRTPIDRHPPPTPIDLSFLKSPLFHIYAFSNILQTLGYFIPGMYLPTFASDVSIPHTHGALLLSLLNLASIVGRILMGCISDLTDIHLPLFLSSFFGALCALFLWGMGNTVSMLIAFALIYGLVAGGYTTLYPRFSQAVARDDEHMELTVYGVLLFQRGLGNVVAGPVSSALVMSDRPLGGYGLGKYEGVVLYVGAALVCSSFGALGKLYKPRVGKWKEGEEGVEGG